MNFTAVVQNLQLFFLIFARVFTMLQVAPLISSSAMPPISRVALALFAAASIVTWLPDYPIPDTGLGFVFLLIMEIIIGMIMGLILVIIFTAFQLSGQFFSLQMGFSASQVFDPLAQIEIPLLGQVLNLIAMMVFLSVRGFQKLFLFGVLGSFQKIRPWDLVNLKEHFLPTIFNSIGNMFANGLLIALPIVGTLMLVSLSMGLLAKASPQMNLLMLGFPINISVALILLVLAMPFIITFFANLIGYSFDYMFEFIGKAGATQ
ncbi:MAG: flagellar biosynthetic protein FliR [Spirochaetales bacterium]|nr:flagellar biosynthetic protein FliR [Spirochaetales bacterium]